jgi:Zn-dependent protease with chaperone function
VYFALAVILLTVTVYTVFVLVFSRDKILNPELLLWVSLGTLAVIGIGSLTKTMALASGGSAVAEMLGGQLINPNTTNPDERKLLNIVEEMSLASGVPVPPVYLMRNEKAINAFAAGHSTKDVAIGVTQGCVQLLNRDELQGVIAHEYSHILNGDMRLNLRLIGLVFGIMCLAIIGRILIHIRGEKNPLPLLGLALILIGGIGVFFGRLIQSAVSRQREFLADAAAVQFTRNPDGLAGALKKIGGLTYGSILKNDHAVEASHMFFGNGVEGKLTGMFATHPPLTQRIKAIDPSFDGSFPAVRMPEEVPPSMRQGAAAPKQKSPFPFIFPEGQRGRTGIPPVMEAVIAAEAVLPNMGAPTTIHLQKAGAIRDTLSPRLQDALHDSMGASAAIYALLLGDDPDLRQKELDAIAALTTRTMPGEVMKLHPEIHDLPGQSRLPLVELALPGLRQLSPSQFLELQKTVQKLIELDGQVSLFEFALQKVVVRHLEPHFVPPRKTAIQFYALKPLVPDAVVLLSALARVGDGKPDRVKAAFQRGVAVVGKAASVPAEPLSLAECGVDKVDAALNRFELAVPQIKRVVLNACAHTVAADGKVRAEEGELLRAIADTLDCPMPPFVK